MMEVDGSRAQGGAQFIRNGKAHALADKLSVIAPSTIPS